jgi:hypothetical protein
MENETIEPPIRVLDVRSLSTAELKAALAEKESLELFDKNKKREDYEALKSSTVIELSKTAIELNGLLQGFKNKSFETLQTLYKMLQEYSKRHADGKGNFQLEVGNYRITYRRQDNGFFDERSVQAEKHIIDFVTEKYVDDTSTKTLIMSLLERKKGALDIKLVQKLYSMEDQFEEPNWKEGIRLLKESWTSSDTRDYVVFEQKDKNNKWVNINLNFSSI